MTFSPDNQDHVEISPPEARQGSMNRWPLRVLILSTIAAAVALGLFMFVPH